MSLLEIIRYKCSQCGIKFKYNNKCRCKMCGWIDAQICLSCHNNNHNKGIYTIVLMYFTLCANSLIASLSTVI